MYYRRAIRLIDHCSKGDFIAQMGSDWTSPLRSRAEAFPVFQWIVDHLYCTPLEIQFHKMTGFFYKGLIIRLFWSLESNG